MTSSDPRTRAREIFRGKLVLAPMTKGSNVPFRRLCREYGADVTVGEMALGLRIKQRRRGELALLRTHELDHPFGAQLADREPMTLALAASMAEDAGSDFVDLNCGCPIDHFTRKGLGASLMRRPARIGELVRAMRQAVTIPVTVKIRLGFEEDRKNYEEIAHIAVEEGADAISMHGRTRDQRYSKAADWDAIRTLRERLDVPVIGNGDLNDWWDFERRQIDGAADALMTARGALIKPWIFQEAKEKRTIHKTPAERISLCRRYVELAKEHFGDDEYGMTRIREFLIWHLELFARYRHLPEAEWRARSLEHPLLQTRLPDVEGDELELLLARADLPAREHIAKIVLGEVDEDAPPPPPPPPDAVRSRGARHAPEDDPQG